MKKHLFYTVLAVFIVTSLVTLMGVTGCIVIPEKYLDKLIWAFLVQLAAAVFSLFRKADFFSEEEKKRLESVEVAVAQTAPVAKKILSTIPSELRKEVAGSPIEIDASEYFEKLADIDDRPLDRDNWLRELNGKQVTWIGTFADIRLQTAPDGAQLQLNAISPRHSMFFVSAPASLRDLAYSLRKGDRIRVSGILNCSTLPSSPLIWASEIGSVE